MSRPKKVLVVSPVATHPAHHGNRQRILQISGLLRAHGFEVELSIGRNQPVTHEARSYWHRIHRLKHAPRWRPTRGLSRLDSWYPPGLGEEVSQIVGESQADGVLLNYVFHSKLFEFLPSETLKIVDTHDVFSNRNNIFLGAPQLQGFFSCSELDEARYLSRADLVIAMSEEDGAHLGALSESPVKVLPFVWEGSAARIKSTHQSNNVRTFGTVMSANDPNRISLKNFVLSVDSVYGPNPPFRVEVAGSISRLAPKISPFSFLLPQRPWLDYVGPMDSLDPFFSRLDAVLVPSVVGSGTAIKFAEAIGRGVPTLSTVSGSRGYKVMNSLHKLPTNRELAVALSEVTNDTLADLQSAGNRTQRDATQRQEIGLKSVVSFFG